MGTNYYWKWNPCPCCGLAKEELHIGKSSFGWAFSLHVRHGDGESVFFPSDLFQWQVFMRAEKDKGYIADEYDRPVDYDDLMDNITRREPLPKEQQGGVQPDGFSVFDPDIGLWRHTYRSRIVKGETYDLCPYEFS